MNRDELMNRSTPSTRHRSRTVTRPGRRRSLPAVAVALASVLAACGGDPPPPPAPVQQQQDALAPVSPGSRLYSDNTGGLVDSTRVVVRNEQEWTALWERATSHRSDPVPRPRIDFAEHMVVVVAAGRMTPEDQIRVDSVGVRSVRAESGELEDVFEVVVRTLEGCGRLRVDAYPFEVVRTTAFEGPVRFIERRSMLEGC